MTRCVAKQLVMGNPNPLGTIDMDPLRRKTTLTITLTLTPRPGGWAHQSSHM